MTPMFTKDTYIERTPDGGAIVETGEGLAEEIEFLLAESRRIQAMTWPPWPDESEYAEGKE